jgi:putative ABC transport system substrate-binding protein
MQFDQLKRREFITLLGGAAATWPLAAQAQQRERMRRIGVLMPLAADDAIAQARNAAFLQGLQQSGWTVGQNIQIEYRWSGGNDELTRRYAAELAALAPEVILASGSAAVGPLLQATRTVPIVFAIVPDPVGAGFVEAWRGRVATRRVSSRSTTASAENGWNCSKKSRRMLRGRRSFGIPP